MEVTRTDDLTALLDAIESLSDSADNNQQQSNRGDTTESNHVNTVESPSPSFSSNKWKLFSASVHCLVQTLISGNASVTLWFAFRSTPISAFQLHVGLSVIGYQLLLAHGILCMRGSGWSAVPYKHRRRLHWILQLAGSISAIAGSAIMINSKPTHFNSLHGKFALAALIFTCASLINGLTSLYATELRRFIPAKLSKISHIVLGTAAFALSSVSLAFGYNKSSFKKWASEEFAYVMNGTTIVYTVAIIIAPSYHAVRKMMVALKIKVC